MNQNEIQRSINAGSACYCLKGIQPTYQNGCKMMSLTSREEHRLQLFET
jgi:hypothetical protein